MHRWVRRLSIIRLDWTPVNYQDEDDDNGNGYEDDDDDGDDDDEDDGDDVAPERADTAALLDVAVHVAWHPWALAPANQHHDKTG